MMLSTDAKQTPRADALKKIANYILGVHLAHPIRVGIDGITASGKSTFARELGNLLANSSREIISTTLDGFHFPKARRHLKGRESAEGYYFDAYNYSAIVENLLAPLGPSGSFQYRTSIFDLGSDTPAISPLRIASKNAILVVDGSFALRSELKAFWDVSIYLNVDPTVAAERASERDAHLFGSGGEAKRITKIRYHAAHSIHNELANPLDSAMIVLSNDDPLHPSLEIRRGPTGG